MSNLDDLIATYRTDSVFRRGAIAYLQEVSRIRRDELMFQFSGSIIDNTMSTVEFPDFDFVGVCDLGAGLAELGLTLVPVEPKGAAVYYRLGVEPGKEELIREHLENQLWFLHQYRSLFPDQADWFHESPQGSFISAENIRQRQAVIGRIYGAAKSDTGAAASAKFKLRQAALHTKKQLLPATLESESNSSFFRYFSDEFIPFAIDQLGDIEIDFDLVTEFTCASSCVAAVDPEATAWERRRAAWPGEDLKQRVRDENVRLITKIDHKGLGERDVDFSLAWPIGVLLQDIAVYRDVLIILKDLFKSHPDKRTALPKSYHLRMIMVWLKQQKYGDDQPEKATFLQEVLDHAIQVFENGFLENFFDTRANLIIDVSEEDRAKVVSKLQDIKDNLVRQIEACSLRPMPFSSALHQIGKHLLEKSGLVAGVEFIADIFRQMDYSRHAPEQDWERRLTFDFFKQVMKVVVLSRDEDVSAAGPKIAPILLSVAPEQPILAVLVGPMIFVQVLKTAGDIKDHVIEMLKHSKMNCETARASGEVISPYYGPSIDVKANQSTLNESALLAVAQEVLSTLASLTHQETANRLAERLADVFPDHMFHVFVYNPPGDVDDVDAVQGATQLQDFAGRKTAIFHQRADSGFRPEMRSEVEAILPKRIMLTMPIPIVAHQNEASVEISSARVCCQTLLKRVLDVGVDPWGMVVVRMTQEVGRQRANHDGRRVVGFRGHGFDVTLLL